MDWSLPRQKLTSLLHSYGTVYETDPDPSSFGELSGWSQEDELSTATGAGTADSTALKRKISTTTFDTPSNQSKRQHTASSSVLVGHIATKCVGCGFYPKAPLLNPGDCVQLLRERDNMHDPNAISVHKDNQKVGHLPRELVQILAPMCDSPETALQLSATTTRGSGGGALPPWLEVTVHCTPTKLHYATNKLNHLLVKQTTAAAADHSSAQKQHQQQVPSSRTPSPPPLQRRNSTSPPPHIRTQAKTTPFRNKPPGGT
eukprot:TRINITY_DN21803_c0_g1_i1.p1 TRINITY_DN21803_c0_g1~~TRINITY_DN21803_c0_g1_i1.p1  ORF type:complete len:259 (-),score=32.03 TRINITY_DN21803_c0_g1_i1:90-866(-)